MNVRNLGIGLVLVFSMVGGACSTPAKIRFDSRPSYEGEPLGSLLEAALREADSNSSSQRLAEFVSAWVKQRDHSTSGELEYNSQQFRILFTETLPGSHLPNYFNEIFPAHHVRVKRINRYTRSGVGGPLLAIRENEEKEAIEKYYPPEAISRPVTGVIMDNRVENGVRKVSIELVCPLAHETIVTNGKSSPVAADYSVSWAALLSRAKDLSRSALRDAIRKVPERDPQLYLMQPYEPEKEPLIMIHGLIDTPLTWADLSNDLWADPEIRARYQIWHFLYNTSAPALYSGRILRNQLRELRPILDPELDDPAMQSTTLLTHSMGGLVGRSLIVEPGDVFWEAAFTRPLSTLELSPDDRESLQRAFFWKPEPHVSTVIFIAVPHRGSHVADHFVGRLGRALINPPSEFRSFYERISSANPGAFTPAYEELGTGKLDSVSALSPDQPTLKILAELPPSHPVKIHSIIGDRGRPGPLEESSDGVVEYWSSHLKFADSEKVVPANHEAFQHPEAIDEIVRILKLPRD